MVFLLERMNKLAEELETLCYPEEQAIENYRMKCTKERFESIENLDTTDWEVFDCKQIWGGHEEYYWFETTVTIPSSFDGKCLVYDLRSG